MSLHPLKSSTTPDMKWVLLKCLLIELDTNEVMVPFKAKSGGRRLAVRGGGAPSARGPRPAPTGQLPHGRPSPSPTAAAGGASNPTPGPAPPPDPGSRWPMAAARASAGSLGALAAPRGRAGAGAPGGGGLPARARSGPAHAPSRGSPPLRAGLFCPGLVPLWAPSREAKGTPHSGQTVAPSGPSRGVGGGPRSSQDT